MFLNVILARKFKDISFWKQNRIFVPVLKINWTWTFKICDCVGLNHEFSENRFAHRLNSEFAKKKKFHSYASSFISFVFSGVCCTSWISCLCRFAQEWAVPYPWHWSSFASSAPLTLIRMHYHHPDGKL